jgi:hypothetical protein
MGSRVPGSGEIQETDFKMTISSLLGRSGIHEADFEMTILSLL